MSSGYSCSPNTGIGSSAAGAEHLDLGHVDFDRAGRQFGILGAGRAPPHLAVDAHHPFGAQLLGLLEGRAVGVGDDLGQPVVVAQVDEQHAAMVADAVAPAGQAHLSPMSLSRSAPQVWVR